MPQARVLLYNYGELREDKIDTLGQRLLNQLLTERQSDVNLAPGCFIPPTYQVIATSTPDLLRLP